MVSYEEAVKQHISRFGVEPVITGANYWQSNKIPEFILDAIEQNRPYVEANINMKEVFCFNE